MPKKNEMEKRYAEVRVNSKEGTYSTEGNLYVEYNVEVENNADSNQAEISIYNMSRSSSKYFTAEEAEVTIIGGWEDHKGTVFVGKVVEFIYDDSKMGDPDIESVIEANQITYADKKIVGKYFPKGTNLESALREVISYTGYNILALDSVSPYSLQKKIVTNGKPKDVLSRLLAASDANHRNYEIRITKKNEIRIAPKWRPNYEDVYVLSPESGLLKYPRSVKKSSSSSGGGPLQTVASKVSGVFGGNSEEQSGETRLKFETLMLPRVKVGSKIANEMIKESDNKKKEDVEKLYVVQKVTHECSQDRNKSVIEAKKYEPEE